MFVTPTLTIFFFLIQVCRIFDIELQKFYIFTHLLYKILPKREITAVEITNILMLEYYTLKKTFSGNIKLAADQNEKIAPVIGGDGTSKIDTKSPLTKILQDINAKFGTNFTDKEKVLEKIVAAFKADKKAVNCAKENTANMFRKAYNYDKNFDEICFDSISQDDELSSFIAENLETLKDALFNYIYDNLH